MIVSVLSAALLLASAAELAAQTAPTIPSFELAYYAIHRSGAADAILQGDFNNDGKSDIVLQGGVGPVGASNATSQNGISLLLGNGNGTFQAPVVVGTASGLVEDMAVADFNNDGKADIITFNNNSTFEVFFGNGNGTFQAPVSFATNAYPISGAVGSFFGDGYTDVAVADNDGNIEVFRNVFRKQGGRNFVLADTIKSVAPPSSSVLLRLRSGDVNGTGVSDLGALTTTGAYVFWNDGRGNFSRVLLSNYAHPAQLNFGDVNQDGRADVIVSFSCGEDPAVEAGRGKSSNCAGLDVYYGEGKNKTLYRRAVADPGPAAVRSIFAADVNGDGIADLVGSGSDATTAADGLYVWLGNADGSFSQTPQVYNAGSTGAMVPGHWNRNGVTDFAQNSAGNLEVYLNAGSNGPRRTSSIRPTDPVCPTAPGTATICYPTDPTDTEATSPLHILANGSTANVPSAVQLYIDGKLILNKDNPGTTYIDTTQTLSTGSHDLVFKLWDAKGNVYTAQKTTTIH